MKEKKCKMCGQYFMPDRFNPNRQMVCGSKTHKTGCSWLYRVQRHDRDRDKKIMAKIDKYVDANVEDRGFNRYWLKAHLRRFLSKTKLTK